MYNSDNLCLKWNGFEDVVKSVFVDLRNDREFTDVTLACDDGQQVEAHKVVLASSSPFFMDLLTRNKHPHPLIIMKGVKSVDLLAVLDFIYLGEASVFQQNLSSYLQLAEEIKIRGLMGTAEELKDKIQKTQEKESWKRTKRAMQKEKISKARKI